MIDQVFSDEPEHTPPIINSQPITQVEHPPRPNEMDAPPGFLPPSPHLPIVPLTFIPSTPPSESSPSVHTAPAQQYHMRSYSANNTMPAYVPPAMSLHGLSSPPQQWDHASHQHYHQHQQPYHQTSNIHNYPPSTNHGIPPPSGYNDSTGHHLMPVSPSLHMLPPDSRPGNSSVLSNGQYPPQATVLSTG